MKGRVEIEKGDRMYNPYYQNPQMLYNRGQMDYMQQQSQQTQQPQMQQPQYNLKGRPVSSFEEAKAAQIDFDGSLFIFPDIANNRIYTKQVGYNGAATTNVYELQEPQMQVQPYVTREEFNNLLAQLKAEKQKLEKIEEPQTTQTTTKGSDIF
jgi:hypothetical protein